MRSPITAVIIALLVILAPASSAAQTQTPEQFFGFTLGTDGELARYPKVVEYLQHLAKTTDRVKFEALGKTTMGNDYVLAVITKNQADTSYEPGNEGSRLIRAVSRAVYEHFNPGDPWRPLP